jgi:hypothetical protein
LACTAATACCRMSRPRRMPILQRGMARKGMGCTSGVEMEAGLGSGRGEMGPAQSQAHNSVQQPSAGEPLLLPPLPPPPPPLLPHCCGCCRFPPTAADSPPASPEELVMDECVAVSKDSQHPRPHPPPPDRVQLQGQVVGEAAVGMPAAVGTRTGRQAGRAGGIRHSVRVAGLPGCRRRSAHMQQTR